MKKFFQYLQGIGPGIFAIGYTIGTGSVTAMVVAGSQYGMQLLWVLFFSCLFSWVLMEAYGRYYLVTGETALYSFRKRLKFGNIIGLLIISCSNPLEGIWDDSIDSKRSISVDTSISYQATLTSDNIDKRRLSKEYQQASNKIEFLGKAGLILDSIIYSHIIPYWYGTPWTFTGHTDTPQKGTIACGYFVSTTLKHAGFNLNRYKLAQAASKQAGEALVGKGNLKAITGSPSKLKEFMMKNCKPGLYFLGLDFHEAYLWLTIDELYIIHSNYINYQGVMKEKALESAALAASKSFWFAPIGGTASLTKKWLLGTRLN